MRFINDIFTAPLGVAWTNERTLAAYEAAIDALPAEDQETIRSFVRFQLVGERSRRSVVPEPFQLAAETDRVFLDTRGPYVLTDPVLGRRLTVEKSGSESTVVWNPWRDRSAAMADLGPGQWRSMLCVETANVGDAAVRLDPGARHSMGMRLRVDK